MSGSSNVTLCRSTLKDTCFSFFGVSNDHFLNKSENARGSNLRSLNMANVSVFENEKISQQSVFHTRMPDCDWSRGRPEWVRGWLCLTRNRPAAERVSSLRLEVARQRGSGGGPSSPPQGGTQGLVRTNFWSPDISSAFHVAWEQIYFH